MIASPYADALGRIPVRSHSADVLGSDTWWWEYGDSDAPTTMVFVHGFRGDHHGLEPIVAGLPGVRVLMPDLPGFGRSGPLPEGGHGITGYSAWLAAFVAGLGLAEPPVVLGHSFGSIIVSAAVSAGMPVSRVVLVNPIGAPALEGPRGIMTRLAVLYYRAGAALPERAGFGLLRNRIVVRIMSMVMAKTRDPALRRWIHDQHDRYFSAFRDRDVVLQAFRASVSHDVREYAADIRTPVLLVAAARDDITPIAAQHALQRRFADARLEVVPEVGHLIHYEAPERAARAVRTFLEEDPA
ncbi:alpha/beta fold hydrolase [Agromyces archimandritae]|uniref:Alpha/beta hydrolase n=1 Tax=Agromyces archimandritae TaxID=2781962 RepID=A0A975FMR7_9MICO|nr:alpha/beta hydrolase [Agromyces archimandritae]QTX04737.1 alpha/beta hydrolase [Agromyces archimandritae]